MRSENQPSGQKRTFVDEARRGQLVRCAIDAIAEVGYQRASLAEIARRAGISKGAVFYHFANRDELIQAAFAQVVSAGAAYIVPRVQAAPTPGAQLRAYITAFVEALQVDPAAIKALLAIGQHDPEQRFLHDRELQDMAIAPLVDILVRGQEAGEFGEFDARSVALVLRAALEAIPAQLIAYPDLDVEAHGHALAGFFERATGGTG